MSLLDRFAAILRDPPPALAFEISEAGIAAARLRPKLETSFQPLKPGTISVSPLRDNILDPDQLSLAVRALAGGNGTRRRRDAALILPDHCARVAVLDFVEFPSDRKEQLSLVRFRLRKSVPFDVEEAAVGYWAQPAGGKKVDVVAAVAPHEIVARYEAPFRAAGMNPGMVTISSLAFLELVSEKSLAVVAKLSGRVLNVMVLDKGSLKLVRSLELIADDMQEVTADLYPTFVYVEDHFGEPARKLLLAGFGERTEEARAQFRRELGIEVEPVRTPAGLPGQNEAGLLGYLRSVAQVNR
jgi:type IV pilus assembly protein PilM